MEDEKQTARTATTREELKLLSKWISDEENLKQPRLWDKILGLAENKFLLEGQEPTVSLQLEPHGELVDN